MKYELSEHEARIIGSLIEKSVTTPDYYPLSLNSLMTACNQKSNREPVMNLSESQVLEVVENLISRRLVSDESGFNSRTSKYQHRFCNTEFGDLQLTEQELGIICCLMLRGPQTPGELRTRTNRLCTLQDVKAAENVLEVLIEKELVAKLPREPGKREIRYRQTFTSYEASEYTEDSVVGMSAQPDRLEALEQEVEELKQEVQLLKAQLDELRSSL
ncbi:YceH family protein [Vibrio mangrovi]|uniref:DUF480 domain-containing protein n=1 Tax=Vibrio mangrovi TaxID=474394 RepID=A0A1Y6ITB2_9VIBR|nr:DUF480 domain-containing protein [Vibrio mangrovi]MDW6004580.1 DUF480 domain-containing protein [Vibrio mangrovi]SMS00868.1 hypothetical protein VIM7927_02139 [Vibrio mangrovi]